jgi:hypothetical protein
MPTATYIALANTTLANNASSVQFSSIPASFRDLVIVIRCTGTVNTQSSMTFNGTGSGQYSWTSTWGNGTTATSNTATSQNNINIHAEATISTTNSGTNIIHIMDYSATDKHKTGLNRLTAPAELTLTQTFRWANTNAITTINFGASFAAGSTFAIYGVAS